MTRAAVLGSGSWGTAFSMVLADAGTGVTLWGRRAELTARIAATHENTDYLPGVRLPDNIWATSDEYEALSGADLVVLAVPSQRLRTNLERWAPLLPPRCTVVSLLKGIEVGTTMRMSEVISEVTGLDSRRIAVVTGPNLAPEISRRQPAAAVVACFDQDAAAAIQVACRTAYFRPYTNVDVVGCELGGAVKNVIALAVGMIGGMDLGDNAKASIITRGLAETARLGRAMGADPMTFAGLAGLGDLTATCFSPLSRNRTFGERLGRGDDVADVAASTHQTAEGVTTCESVIELADRVGVDMPICEQVLRVVRGKATPRDVVESLMSRSAKPEM